MSSMSCLQASLQLQENLLQQRIPNLDFRNSPSRKVFGRSEFWKTEFWNSLLQENLLQQELQATA